MMLNFDPWSVVWINWCSLILIAVVLGDLDLAVLKKSIISSNFSKVFGLSMLAVLAVSSTFKWSRFLFLLGCGRFHCKIRFYLIDSLCLLINAIRYGKTIARVQSTSLSRSLNAIRIKQVVFNQDFVWLS